LASSIRAANVSAEVNRRIVQQLDATPRQAAEQSRRRQIVRRFESPRVVLLSSDSKTDVTEDASAAEIPNASRIAVMATLGDQLLPNRFIRFEKLGSAVLSRG
jgi:hypothetical protein